MRTLLWNSAMLLSITIFISFCPGNQMLAVAAEPMDLATVLQQAAAADPQLQRLTLEEEARRAEAKEASVKPPLTVDLEAEHILGNRSFKGVEGAAMGVSATIPLEAPDKRKQRVKTAELRTGQVQQERDLQNLARDAAVKRDYLEVLVLKSRLRLLEDALDRARRVYRDVNIRAEAGAIPETERDRARLAQAEAIRDLRACRRNLAGARELLQRQWSLTPGDIRITGKLRLFSEGESLSKWAGQLEKSFEWDRFNVETDLRRAELGLARKERRLDPEVAIGMQWDRDADAAGFQVGLSLPLPRRRAGLGTVQAAQKRLAQVAPERAAWQKERLHLLHDAVNRMESYRLEALEIREDELPRARTLFERIWTAYRDGKETYLEVLEASDTLVQLGIAEQDALAGHHRARIDAEELTGKIDRESYR